MNLYFDTEFTGLVPGTTLISLGIISENGDKFYAEFNDYNEDLVDDWVRENVISKLWSANPENARPGDTTYIYGDSKTVKENLLLWIDTFRGDEKILFVSDVCHYDFYLLLNLFGGAFKIPKFIIPCCYDINQAMCDSDFKGVGGNYATAYNMLNAFDCSRERYSRYEEDKKFKHNALYDAIIIKNIYEMLYGMENYNLRFEWDAKKGLDHKFAYADTWYEKMVFENAKELYKKLSNEEFWNEWRGNRR